MALNKSTKTLHGFPDWHATSLDDFYQWVEGVKSRTHTDILIFRGQRKKWGLLPNLSRHGEVSEIKTNEKRLFEAFKKHGEPCLHQVPTNDWDWLVVAQHHGLYTRLLDWTYSPLVALWFALEKSDEENSEPIVWALSPLKTDFVDDLEYSRPLRGTRTKVFETSFKIPRVNAQEGCFTLFRHDEKFPKGFTPIERNKYLRERIERVRIAPSACQNILQELEHFGYCKDRLFPDIDTVAERVNNEVFGYWTT